MNKDRYAARTIAADSTNTLQSGALGGFFAVTAGTITINSNGAAILSAFPVAAGSVTPLPFYVGPNGGTFVTAGGASGTLAV